jgi:hypothetical protein
MHRIISWLRPQRRASGRQPYQWQRDLLAERVAAAKLRQEYDQYRTEAVAHAQETDRVIAELQAKLAGAVAERDQLCRLETLAIKDHDELRAELRARRDTATTTTGRLHPEPIQALVDWYLRKSVTAVLALPSRDSVRAALEAWQPAPVPGVCEKCHQRPVWKPAGQWLDGHFCEPCISDCHEQVEGHMCLIDRWRPSKPVTTSPRQE